MSDKSDLAVRMKENYEKISQTKLMRRTPVAIRLDGKAFHTFTRGFQRPYDKILGNAMVKTMEYLCENIQGCIFGYTQSDEITLILIDYQTLTTAAWFNYEVQKLCSISASMATMAFNKFFEQEIHKAQEDRYDSDIMYIQDPLFSHIEKIGAAMFDARCFNIPKEEVCNLIYWRQLDATRNSIQMMGQAYFSHNELDEKTCSNIQDMLMEKYNINWNNTETRWKRGVAWRKDLGVDFEMPILKGENRSYVDDLIFIEE